MPTPDARCLVGRLLHVLEAAALWHAPSRAQPRLLLVRARPSSAVDVPSVFDSEAPHGIHITMHVVTRAVVNASADISAELVDRSASAPAPLRLADRPTVSAARRRLVCHVRLWVRGDGAASGPVRGR